MRISVLSSVVCSSDLNRYYAPEAAVQKLSLIPSNAGGIDLIANLVAVICGCDLCIGRIGNGRDLQFSVKDHTPEGCGAHITLPHFKGVALIQRKLERDQANEIGRANV